VYWRCTPTECTPFFTSPVSKDQDRAGVAEGVDDVVTQIIAHRLGVPFRPRQQMLQPVGRVIAAVLGDRPAILAVQPRDHPRHEFCGMPQRFVAGETRRDPINHRRELSPPPINVYAMSRGDRGQLWIRHKPITMPRSPPLPAQTRPTTPGANYGCGTSTDWVDESGQRNINLTMMDGSRHEIKKWGKTTLFPASSVNDRYVDKNGKLISDTLSQQVYDGTKSTSIEYGDGTIARSSR
jgi:hypothetical protein